MANFRKSPKTAKGMKWGSGALALLLFITACTPSAREVAPGLYLVQRGASAWELTHYAAPDSAAGTVLYTDLEGYAVGPTLALITAEGIGLWDGQRLEPLHPCAMPCRALSWSADGTWLAWVEEGQAEETDLVWLWSRAQGAWASGLETVGEPAWSPISPTLAIPQQTQLVLLEVGEMVSHTLPYAARGRPAWAPDGRRMAVLLASGEVAILTLTPFAASGLAHPPDRFVQREALAWSPDGRWLVVTERRFMLQEHGAEGTAHVDLGGSETLGPQPWLYPLAGGAPIPLPGDPAAAFARPVWSPDGRYLALTHLPIGQTDPRPAVWLYDVAARSVMRVFPAASAPAWR